MFQKKSGIGRLSLEGARGRAVTLFKQKATYLEVEKACVSVWIMAFVMPLTRVMCAGGTKHPIKWKAHKMSEISSLWLSGIYVYDRIS